MKFTKAQIAALVLGYLKSEKLHSVYDEFIKTSPHLKESNENIKFGKYYVTRVAGMSLVDFLEQYSIVYTIVQGRLEETNYYDLYNHTTLVDQLLYLLESQPPASSTPDLNVSSEVDATPAHTLPGNSSVDCDPLPKTPKKRCLRSSKEKDDGLDMTEVLTQSLLEHHELHEKIAETINIVRNAPEVAKTVTDEHISAGASKELDAVIKTVIQRTEEDPVYNKLIDEIIGTTAENPPAKKQPTCSTPTSSLTAVEEAPVSNPEEREPQSDPIDDHNNAAIRSIIEVAQSTSPPLLQSLQKPEANGEVYVFDGTLDSYLKTSGATTSLNQNPVYINPGLIVMPPPETNPNQFYIVNNQPMIKMNVYSENEIMSLPTVIVSDEPAPAAPPQRRRPRVIKPKLPEPIVRRPKVTEALTVVTEPENAARQASHVRNLDFSTPAVANETKSSKSTWDADLRELISGCKDKSPSPKRKKVTKKKKKKDDEKIEAEERGMLTPVKDQIPKTPVLETSFHGTPFTAVLDEQLKGVDLTSIPTPNIPITPGFSLTPGEMLGPNQRLTDYSTSSSYYQPSDSEQNKTMGQLLEECKEFEKSSESEGLKVLSNIVLEKAKNEHLTKFHNSLVGKKNLNLIKRHSSLSSSSSDSEIESEGETTVICKKNNTNSIKDIISTVDVKKTLDKDTTKGLLMELEQKRQRTVNKIKKSTTEKKPRKKRTTKKKQNVEAEKLVEGLAQRGIHLIPKKQENETDTQAVPEENPVVFEPKVYDEIITISHEDKTKRKPLKSYDFEVLKKSMSAKVFIDDLNQEVTRIMKWTNCESLLSPETIRKLKENDDLMDFCVAGKREQSPKGRKRRKLSNEGVKQKEKKNKSWDQNAARLLNDDNAVEALLDKIHPE